MPSIDSAPDHLTLEQMRVLRDVLVEERDRVLRSHEGLRESLSRSREDGVSGDTADIGSEVAAREQASVFASRGGRRLSALDDALDRLLRTPDEFGLCTVCGAGIRFDRLELLPTTRQCQQHAAGR